MKLVTGILNRIEEKAGDISDAILKSDNNQKSVDGQSHVLLPVKSTEEPSFISQADNCEFGLNERKTVFFLNHTAVS